MASANNWLGFSLSGQGNPQLHQNGSPAAASIDVSGGGDFYGLQDQTPPEAHLGMSGLRADTNYGVMDGFNGGNQETQGWAMRGLDYHGGSSELSMVVGSSGGRMTVDDGEAPKLEDFLGGISFSDVQDHAGSYLFSSGGATIGGGAATSSHGVDGGRGGSTIELSMIKTWLRNDNNQAQHEQAMSADASATTYACSGALGASGNDVGAASSRGQQGLALSMSMGSNSHPQMPVVAAAAGGGAESTSSENKRVDSPSAGTGDAVQRKSIDTFGQRTSIYRGVTRHRWTGRYEAHLWDNSCRREGQTRKGKQGGYDKEDKAARAYDLAALKYWGTTTTTNIPISTYEKEIEEMKHMTRQEYIAYLRRNSSGFSRGASKYRGVTRHHQQGRWQARIGRVAGNKDLYLGTFTTEEEAAEAYDIAAIKFRGLNAVTNFEMSRYDVKSILEGSTLPMGGAARRLKEAAELAEAGVWRAEDGSLVSHLHTADSIGMGGYHHGWPTSIAFGGHQQQPSAAQHLAAHYPQYAGHGWCKTEQDAVIAAGHGAQDAHQELHLGTHNFFQLPASRTAVYGNGGGAWYQGLGGNAFMMPVGTTVDAGEQGHSGSTATTEDGRLVGYSADQGGVDPYAAMRRAYELSQGSSSVSVAKVADGYSNNWSSPFSGMG
ncbi:hypothetical protein ACQ4PT_040442 [Festuca glaucescens]